jgi:hypothetical protein
MFRQGPFPTFVHALVEYIGGGLFIALPLLLSYDSGAATGVSIVIGVVVIAVAASTDWGPSLNNQIPRPAHFALDWAVAGLLIASPFLFGFSKESTPTAIFIVAGVLHILLTIGTRFGKTKPRPRAQRAVEPQQPSEPESPAGTGDRRSARRS